MEDFTINKEANNFSDIVQKMWNEMWKLRVLFILILKHIYNLKNGIILFYAFTYFILSILGRFDLHILFYIKN